jgi:antitoxin (DNA-binding transcriptional repressor) of toxin-antitoxin stability system
VKTITIRDLRQRWPEAEAALELEEEILITRDSKPVAKLVRITPDPAKRPRWDAEAHARWQKKIAGGKVVQTNEILARNRADRSFSPKRK